MKRKAAGTAVSEANGLGNKVLLRYPVWDTPESEDESRISDYAVFMIIGDFVNSVSGILMNAPFTKDASRGLIESIGLRNWDGVVHCGGSLRDENIRVFHESGYSRRGTIDINDRVSMTASPRILHDVADGNGPKNMALVYGFQQWIPGRLRSEIESGKWIVADYHDSMFFTGEGSPRDAWTKAYSAHFDNVAEGITGRALKEFDRRIAEAA